MLKKVGILSQASKGGYGESAQQIIIRVLTDLGERSIDDTLDEDQS